MSNTVMRFDGSWQRDPLGADKLAQELTKLGQDRPWTIMLAALTHGTQTWVNNLVRCTLRYDKWDGLYILNLNNLAA